MLLSIVIPVYNGSSSIERLVQQICTDFMRDIDFEIILVNDSSPDDSWQKILEVQKIYPAIVTAINLARNYGEHNAVMAGYRYCQGKYVVNIDDDFQNPPSEIMLMLEKIKQGYDVVYSYYRKKEHSTFRNFGSRLNNRVANIMLKKPKDLYLSSFRIITGSLRKEIIKYQGPFPYIDGLIVRATDKIGTQEVKHLPRESGTSNYTLKKLVTLWSHLFFNFSVAPLRFATLTGLIFCTLGIVGVFAVIIMKIVEPGIPSGWASILASFLILSGTQLFMLGIVGEYVGRLFLTSNMSPQYFEHEVIERRSDK